MVDKNVLLHLIKKQAEEEESLLASLSNEEKSRKGTPDDWSIKDLVAHANSWKQHLGENLKAVAAGNPGRASRGDDEENAATFAKFQDQSWENVAAFAKSASQLLFEQTGLLTVADLERTDYFSWEDPQLLWRDIVSTGYTHPVIHFIEHALKNRDISLVARLHEQMARELPPLSDDPSWEGLIQYNLACYYSLSGDVGRSIDSLRRALELNPGLTEWSKSDPDFERIRGESEYIAIYG